MTTTEKSAAHFDEMAEKVFTAIAEFTEARIKAGVEKSHGDILALLVELEKRIAQAEALARKA